MKVGKEGGEVGKGRKENLTHNPGAHGGVSNCVIKYVTGSLDAAVEAWSRCRAEVRDTGRKENKTT